MKGTNHVAAGTIAAITLNQVFLHYSKPEDILLFGACAVLGSLAPDMDHPKAKINQKILLIKSKTSKLITYLALAALSFVGLFRYTNIYLASSVAVFLGMMGVSKHRGMSHKVAGVGVTAIMCYIVGMHVGKVEILLYGFLGAYVLHILCDYLSTWFKKR